jgi:hypothetical protein
MGLFTYVTRQGFHGENENDFLLRVERDGIVSRVNAIIDGGGI